MSRPAKWWHTLQASKNEARLAVDLYNRSSQERSLEGFVVHMNLAWLYLLHARLERDGIDFRYWVDARRLKRVRGKPQTWGLRRCLREEYEDENDPVRRNVEFFIELRDRIEHRYAELIATVVAGKTQAHVLNYEEALTARFGARESLGDALRFPVFTSSLTPSAVTALKGASSRSWQKGAFSPGPTQAFAARRGCRAKAGGRGGSDVGGDNLRA